MRSRRGKGRRNRLYLPQDCSHDHCSFLPQHERRAVGEERSVENKSEEGQLGGKTGRLLRRDAEADVQNDEGEENVDEEEEDSESQFSAAMKGTSRGTRGGESCGHLGVLKAF